MQIIPAIDIIEGKCVRLTEGDYTQKKIYNEDPLEVAKQFEGVGLMRLHLVDLDGAKAGAVVNWKVLEKIANKTGLIIDFGGGIKTEVTLKTVLDTGATYATIGSLAVKESATFEEWIERFGAQIFMLGADVYEEKIAVGGWLENHGLFPAWQIHQRNLLRLGTVHRLSDQNWHNQPTCPEGRHHQGCFFVAPFHALCGPRGELEQQG